LLNVLGFKDDFQAYTFDPLANLTGSQPALVLGGMRLLSEQFISHYINLSSIGQQLLWTEQSGAENLDSIVWPRAAVSAEVALTFFKFKFSLILYVLPIGLLDGS